MTNDSETNSPRLNVDDAVLDLHLGSLPLFDPRPGFGGRVMARVVVPASDPLEVVIRSARSLIATRRIRWFAAGLLATYAISLAFVAGLLLNNSSSVDRVLEWMTGTVGLPLWRAFLGFASASAFWVYALLHPLFVSHGSALIAAAASLGFLAFNACMLIWLMRPGRMAGSD